jgi:AraC-like DNA-binding protein
MFNTDPFFDDPMSNTTDSKNPQIVYSCTSKRTVEGELFIRQHVFDYIISGTSEVFFEGKSYLHQAGEVRFARRNRLSKFTKIPPPGGEYQSVSVCIDQRTLEEMSLQYKPAQPGHANNDNVFLLKSNRLFNNYIDSLLPYLVNSGQISSDLVRLKIREAILIFMEANPELKHILFDFQEPGKIDLEAYMNEHYQFNGDLQHFAYLTGRSLSTFKRDFEHIFKMTPSRWLINKRLGEAHFLLKEKKRKATDIYMDVGFKDYSHFSLAFKKAFGHSPSMIA